MNRVSHLEVGTHPPLNILYKLYTGLQTGGEIKTKITERVWKSEEPVRKG